MNGETSGYDGLTVLPQPLNCSTEDKLFAEACREDWKQAVDLARVHGVRNAQTTVVAPTGTIGLVMDCDTTGIEPDFSLSKI